MRKLVAENKKAPTSQPPPVLPLEVTQPDTNHGGWENGRTFLANILKASGITRKELQYELRWSDTYTDKIISGEKNDPFSQSRKICLALLRRRRADLVAASMAHIGGGDDFDGRVFTPEQWSMFQALMKVVQG